MGDRAVARVCRASRLHRIGLPLCRLLEGRRDRRRLRYTISSCRFCDGQEPKQRCMKFRVGSRILYKCAQVVREATFCRSAGWAVLTWSLAWHARKESDCMNLTCMKRRAPRSGARWPLAESVRDDIRVTWAATRAARADGIRSSTQK